MTYAYIVRPENLETACSIGSNVNFPIKLDINLFPLSRIQNVPLHSMLPSIDGRPFTEIFSVSYDFDMTETNLGR